MKRIWARVSDELFERVEAARGETPRERWLRQTIEQRLARDALTPAQARRLLQGTGFAPENIERMLSDSARH